ncbi:hypothetical protein ONS95_007696 [Cadophora gregata]|uniref:uncharacterized protein n=1 Tax=Cadophora gregata TaxID=51156 RepID=UPI0026DAB8F1|nr:uncharacterized protein ONS95_007696 [Cadophora gregata]KAK0118815.1 hypothetical protein ONS96_011897 [Cadophora gregata f. sp. sojae]KAK0126076.1 hypothetical protein ONS95_007696 [Cadophora gregata]
MLRLSFLYQSSPIEDTFQNSLRSNLLTLFEERFLLLTDAAYLYLIDQDLTRSEPKWDEYKKEVLRVFKSLPTRPTLVDITPDLADLPIHVDISNRSRDIWLR